MSEQTGRPIETNTNGTPSAPLPDEGLLRRNLTLLCARTPGMVEQILTAPDRPIELVMTPEGAWSGTVTLEDGRRVQLASLRRPLEEAKRLAGTVDVREAACVMIVGFGLGYHVGELSRAMGATGLILVYEPDLALLRAVLSRLDCTAHLAAVNIVLVSDTEDSTVLLRAFEGHETIIAAGLKIVEHAPSVTRIGTKPITDFMKRVAELTANVRTHVVTSLCNVAPSVGNMLRNTWKYATAGTVEELRDSAAGRAAVVISAGPSLMRNIDLLARPGVRDRVVLIAAQTTLKPLLARGIKPHFVTALDYSDVSTRFYEGLTAEDVEGITLVAEPKGSPGIFAAWPGELRCTTEDVIDDVLGLGQNGMAREMGRLRSGSTVAHLSYYLARHMGCDPVILVGQDLAFTDGQYYSPGAAIHQVWSGELSEFNTLEMLEWQRIVRMRLHLHKVTDHLGRPVYTDEQMNTYRVQFEKEFAEDKFRGLIVIDATEGGVHKEHTRSMSLADALERYAPEDLSPWYPPTADTKGLADPARKRRVLSKLVSIREDTNTLRGFCEKTKGRLKAILAANQRPEIVNPVIEEVQEISKRAASLGAAYRLTQFVNQTGMLRRFKTDRKIRLDKSMNEMERQARRVERDIENMVWLSDSAEETASMVDEALAWIKHGIKPQPKASKLSEETSVSTSRVGVAIAVNTEVGGLGTGRSLSTEICGGRNALQLTVARALASKEACGVYLMTSEAAHARELLGELVGNPRVKVVEEASDPLAARRDSVRAGRLWTRSCWRGGLGNLTVFDEAFAPSASARLCESEKLDGIAVIGSDWCLVDPTSLDEAILRHRHGLIGEGSRQQMVFVHAACGLGACIIDRRAVNEIARTAAANGPFASIGALLGYIPVAPQPDPLGKTPCVTVVPAARDLGLRVIADHPVGIRAIAAAYAAGGTSLADAVAAVKMAGIEPALETLTLELNQGERRMTVVDAVAAIEGAVKDAQGGPIAVTLEGTDPLAHPELGQVVAEARRLGVAGVHVRSPLDRAASLAALCVAKPDVISVDMYTTDDDAYEQRTGRRTMQQAINNVKEIVARRQNGPDGLVWPWVAPRITRRDDEYERIETFYDHWLMLAGACVIDPLSEAIPGDRIAPLEPPAAARERLSATARRVTLGAGGQQMEIKPGVAAEAA